MADTVDGMESGVPKANRRPREVDESSHGGKRRKRTRPRRKRGKELFSSKYLSGTASVRAHQVRKDMFANGQPVAPYNTTQFLIEDHGDLQNIDLTTKPQRTRDSSFSIESDDEFFYSSPEDEEEFLSREFSNEYQDLNVERLNSLSKAEIIRDYLLLESRYESLIDVRRSSMGKTAIPSNVKVGDSGRDTDASSRSDHDLSEQLRLENRRLKTELEKLKRENSQLQAMVRGEPAPDSDSIDSESDSSSSTSVTSTNSDRSRSNTPIITPHDEPLDAEQCTDNVKEQQEVGEEPLKDASDMQVEAEKLSSSVSTEEKQVEAEGSLVEGSVSDSESKDSSQAPQLKINA